MLRSHCHVPTPDAERLLSRLCKHFAHKIPARWAGAQGELMFSIGDCQLTAGTAGLDLACSASSRDELDELQAVMQRHLQGFLALEHLALSWECRS